MKQLPPNVGKFVNFHTHNAFTWGNGTTKYVLRTLTLEILQTALWLTANQTMGPSLTWKRL